MILIRTVLGVVVMFCFLIEAAAADSKIEYQITFTPTWVHPNFGSRNLEGRFVVDYDGLNSSVNGSSYAPSSFVMNHVSDYVLTLNGGLTYSFDPIFTSRIVQPAISTALLFGNDGTVIDVGGGFRHACTLSEIILGRDGEKGQYFDLQQVDPFNSVVVSRGTFVVQPVPEPETLALVVCGCLIFACRRRLL